MHISYESGILENPKHAPNKEMFEWTTSPQNAPDTETHILIYFKDGIRIAVEAGKIITVVTQKTMDNIDRFIKF